MAKSLRQVAKEALLHRALILRPTTTDEIREHINGASQMSKNPQTELRNAVHMNTIATLMLIDRLEKNNG